MFSLRHIFITTLTTAKTGIQPCAGGNARLPIGSGRPALTKAALTNSGSPSRWRSA